MAKVSYTKLTPIKKIEPINITINNVEISVIQYLPIDEKTDLISEVLNNVIDLTGQYNPVRFKVWFEVMMIKYYTNISITDKLLENISKLYDALEQNKVISQVLAAIPEEEYTDIYSAAEDCAHNIVDYNTSLLGMVQAINTDYQLTKSDIDQTVEKIENPENLTLVKNILEKIN